MTNKVPGWAIKRVCAALDDESGPPLDVKAIARRTGLNRHLARECLIEVYKSRVAQSAAGQSAPGVATTVVPPDGGSGA